jgi:hypothetical protein
MFAYETLFTLNAGREITHELFNRIRALLNNFRVTCDCNANTNCGESACNSKSALNILFGPGTTSFNIRSATSTTFLAGFADIIPFATSSSQTAVFILKSANTPFHAKNAMVVNRRSTIAHDATYVIHSITALSFIALLKLLLMKFVGYVSIEKSGNRVNLLVAPLF